MRALLIALAVSGTAAGQGIEFQDAAAEAWFSVPFEERERLFSMESRETEWAEPMEQAIAEEVASWTNPPVRLVSAECRATLCRIDTSWPGNVGLQQTGQQLSYLWGLGLDHQGHTSDSWVDRRYRWVVILRRR